MSQNSTASKSQAPVLLDIFCARVDQLWEVTVAPGWVPPLLAPFFDQHGESASMLLDFEDLDHFMKSRGATYEKRVSKLGSVQLMARDDSARELGRWLTTAFSSGVRRPRS